MRFRGQVSGGRGKLFRAVAMDAGFAAVEAGCDLARAFAGDEQSSRRRSLYRKFPALGPRAWFVGALLFALSQASVLRARFGIDAMFWPNETSIA